MRNNFKFCSLGLVLLGLSSNAFGQSAARDYDLDSVQDSASVSTSGGNSACQINSGANGGGVLAQLALPFPSESATNAVWATDAGIPRATPYIGVAVSIREAGSAGTSHIFVSPAGLNLSGAMPLPPGAIIEDLAFISDQTGDGRPDLVVEYAAIVGPNWVSVIDSSRCVEVGRFIDVSLAAVIQAAQGGQIIALTGDLTGDGAVSQSDLMVLFEGIGEPYSIELDVNADGEVDALDIASLVEQLGQILSLGLSQSSPLQSSGSAGSQTNSTTPSSGSNSCLPCDNPPTESGTSPPDPACDALGSMSLDCPGPVFPGQSYSVSVLAWLGGIDISDISICIELPDGSVQGSLTATGIAPSEPGEYPIFVRVRYGSCCRTLQCNLLVIDPQNPPFDPGTPPSCGPSGLSLQIVPPLGGRLGSGCPQVPPALASLTSIPSIGTNDIVQLAAKIMPSGTFANGYVRWQLSASSGGCVRGLSLRQSSVQEVFELQPGQLAAGCTITVRAIYVFDDMRCPPLTAECTFQVSADSDFDGLLDTYEDLVGCTIPLAMDTDRDTYFDGEEVLQYGTNPCDPNSAPAGTRRNLLDDDNDGLPNYVERFLGMSLGFNRSEVSDATLPDTDGDMMIDLAELWLGTDPSIANDWNPSVIALWQKIDADLDLLPDELELARGTDPLEPDSNGNKILDGVELIFGITDVDASNVFVPTANDQDGDGIADSSEQSYNADPLNADTDGDGLSDWLESKLNTSAAEVDTDGDGILDEEEVRFGLDPTRSDTDRDGILDGDEDWDGDGANNMNEAANGSNPRRVDTDGDGVSDRDELFNQTDPTDPSDSFTPTGGRDFTLQVRLSMEVPPVLLPHRFASTSLRSSLKPLRGRIKVGNTVHGYMIGFPNQLSHYHDTCIHPFNSSSCEGEIATTNYAERVSNFRKPEQSFWVSNSGNFEPGAHAIGDFRFEFAIPLHDSLDESGFRKSVVISHSLVSKIASFGRGTYYKTCCDDCTAPKIGYISTINAVAAWPRPSNPLDLWQRGYHVNLSQTSPPEDVQICGGSHRGHNWNNYYWSWLGSHLMEGFYGSSAESTCISVFTQQESNQETSITAEIVSVQQQPLFALQDWYKYARRNDEVDRFVDPRNPGDYVPTFIGTEVGLAQYKIDQVAADGASIVFFHVPPLPNNPTGQATVYIERSIGSTFCENGSLLPTAEAALSLAPHSMADCWDFTVVQAIQEGSPVFYVPPSESPDGSGHRIIYIWARWEDSQGRVQRKLVTRIWLVRPPVLLVHGLFGSGEILRGGDAEDSYWSQSFMQDMARIQGAGIESWVSNYNADHVNAYDETYRNVPLSIDIIRRNWRRLPNLSGANNNCRIFANLRFDNADPVQHGNRLVTRVDVIGHSMGGVITQVYMSNIANDRPVQIVRRVLGSTTMSRSPDYYDPDPAISPNGGTRYYRRSNLNKGDIRRFVSIGTPFYGSRLGNLVCATMKRLVAHYDPTRRRISQFEKFLRSTDENDERVAKPFRERLIDTNVRQSIFVNGERRTFYSGTYSTPYSFEDLAEPLYWESVDAFPRMQNTPVMEHSFLHRLRYRNNVFYPPGQDPPAEPDSLPGAPIISPLVEYPRDVPFYPIATLIVTRSSLGAHGLDLATLGASLGLAASDDFMAQLFPSGVTYNEEAFGLAHDGLQRLLDEFRGGLTSGQGDGVVPVASQRCRHESTSLSSVDTNSWGLVFGRFVNPPSNMSLRAIDEVGHSRGVFRDSYQTHRDDVLLDAYRALHLRIGTSTLPNAPSHANRFRTLNDQ